MDTLLPNHFKLGECPVWDEIEQALYFADVGNRTIHRYDWRSRELRGWKTPEECGSFGLRKDGKGAVVAQKSTIELLDFATGRMTVLAHVKEEESRPTYRFNDGKVGPDGRFWVGSMDGTMGGLRKLAGALYRVEPDGAYKAMVEGIGLTNGLAWSPDGGTMYHADFSQHVVRAYDYHQKSGNISGERLFCQLDATTGAPDGAAVDAEGYYWSAGFRAGRLNRIAPDGRIERHYDMPVKFPTMPCFCGPDLKTLIVTSLTHPVQKEAQEGMIFTMRVEVPGLPADRFLG